jgi:hypothetical protein
LPASSKGTAHETLSLKDGVQQLLDEARMVLPGIQALLGFQLIACFNEGFAGRLDLADQRLHLLATLLVTLATGLVMAPAAYHRHALHREVTEDFLRLGSRLSIEIFVVSRLVTESLVVSLGVAGATLLILLGLWVGLPLWRSAARAGRSGQSVS